jgi:hypothetical protein
MADAVRLISCTSATRARRISHPIVAPSSDAIAMVPAIPYQKRSMND